MKIYLPVLKTSIKLLNCHYKFFSITTDGAPAMTSCRNDEDFTDFLQYYCIIHQQVPCAKVLNMQEIMNIAFKISNSIRTKSIQRRLFKGGRN